ncbi:MAG: thioredoxin fold domain-containing protein [Candidatus Methanoperedens sp.]|nr:thioredoxin fold domain-containing protein [Candidatus Methanoperedens sp.]
MTPANKLISFVVLGIILIFMGYWWENSNSSTNSDFINLGKVSFHTSLDPGIKEAKNLSKPIFLYFRSETCYWCIRFEEEALSDKRIIEMLDKNFVLISIDIFEQKNVSINLNVRTTPYMIFFTKDGEEISRIPGYLPADDFLARLKDVLEKQELKQSLY